MLSVFNWAKNNKRIVAAAIIIFAFFIIRSNLYNITLLQAGLQETHMVSVVSDIGIFNRRQPIFKVIYSNHNGVSEFANLQRTALGTWRIVDRSSERDTYSGALTHTWYRNHWDARLGWEQTMYFVYHNTNPNFANVQHHFRNYMGFGICDPAQRRVPFDEEEFDDMFETRLQYGLIRTISRHTTLHVINYGSANSYIIHIHAPSKDALATLEPIYQRMTEFLFSLEPENGTVIYEMFTSLQQQLQKYFGYTYIPQEPQCPPSQPTGKYATTYFPHQITVYINNHPTLFDAYVVYTEFYSDIFFAVEDMEEALYRTQGILGFWQVEGCHTINGRAYTSWHNVAVHTNIDVLHYRSMFIIDTHEPYISAYHRQLVEDFLFENYPQIFTYHQMFEDFGSYFDNVWHPIIAYAAMFNLFDNYDNMPIISIRFYEPGSSSGFRLYALDDGEFYEVMPWMPLIPVGDMRQLIALWHDVYDSIYQRLWHMTTLVPCGTPVDATLYNKVFMIIPYFFEDKPNIRIDGIYWSLIKEDLIRVRVWRYDWNWYTHFWFEFRYFEGIIRYTENLWFYENTTRWQYPRGD